MKDWRAASDKIRRRTIAEITDSLAVEAPFSFSPIEAESDTPAYLDANWELLKDSSDNILSYPGRDTNYVNDTLMCVTKFWHVVQRASANFDQGALTWAVMDAYHACLMGARAISALSGVLSYSLRGRTVLVDFRPEFGSPDERKVFAKSFRNTDDPIRVLCPQSRQLEQKDVWNILARICALSTSSDPNKDSFNRISNYSAQPLSQPRNLVFYDSVAWLWRTDFRLQMEDVKFGQSVDAFDVNVDTTLAALIEIFAFSKVLLGQLSSRIGFDPLRLSDISTVDPESLLKAA